MKIKNIATAADGTKFERMATSAYEFAVIYHKKSGGYYTPTMHSRRDLAERAAADVGPSTVRVEIVPVEIERPSVRRVRNEIAKAEKSAASWRGKGYDAIADRLTAYADELRAAYPEAA